LLAGIAVAATIGALARYLVDASVIRRAVRGLPAATLVINVTGPFVLGISTGLVLSHALPATPKIISGTGFCGACTTFPTFADEVVRLTEEREHRAAALTLALSVVVPALVAGLGLACIAVTRDEHHSPGRAGRRSRRSAGRRGVCRFDRCQRRTRSRPRRRRTAPDPVMQPPVV